MPALLRRPKATTPENPNHHLYLHGKIWWIYCAVNPTPKTKDKLRRSLVTESVTVARASRDEIFRRLASVGMLRPLRVGSVPRAPGILERTTPMGMEYAEAIVDDVVATTPENFPAPVIGAGEKTP